MEQEKKELLNKNQVELWTRTIAYFIVIFNMLANHFGWVPLDISNDVIYNFVSYGCGFIVLLWGYWKNNSWTVKAKAGDIFKDIFGNNDEVIDKTLQIAKESEKKNEI